jgi:hypothetical protein
MEDTIFLYERPVRVLRTERARRTLEKRPEPLTVELELFFSCLLRMRVRFPEPGIMPEGPGTVGTPDGQLIVRFRPVMSRHCSLEEGHQLEAFPIAQPEPFVPRWVRIDYHPRHGWRGELGYAHDEPAA